MTEDETTLDRAALERLIERVFRPGTDERSLAILVDLPDEHAPDTAAWAARRLLALEWWVQLGSGKRERGVAVDLYVYRNVRRNNADLPRQAWRIAQGSLPPNADAMPGEPVELTRVFADYPMLIAINQFSATAPLKIAAALHGFRAASMPGFGHPMVPALDLDWVEIDSRCVQLKRRLDRAVEARLHFRVDERELLLRIDLRHRRAIASGGLLTRPGVAGNLPSGETYIVPYEGEIDGDPSRTAGELPLELGGELLVYRIERNRIVSVEGAGPAAAAERAEVAREPAYRNVAELGLGILAGYGIRPVGEILLDEKLGLHVAFGRSDHFGGTVGAAQFSAPDRVVHIDRVYIPAVQPRVHVVAVELRGGAPQSEPTVLMRDGRFT